MGRQQLTALTDSGEEGPRAEAVVHGAECILSDLHDGGVGEDDLQRRHEAQHAGRGQRGERAVGRVQRGKRPEELRIFIRRAGFDKHFGDDGAPGARAQERPAGGDAARGAVRAAFGWRSMKR